jgi:hypothetical protein
MMSVTALAGHLIAALSTVVPAHHALKPDMASTMIAVTT